MKAGIGARLLIPALVATSAFADFENGKVFENVICKENTHYSYLLYLPTTYTPEREDPWPVIFLIGHNGGQKVLFNKFIPAAEQNGLILAMSNESKNNFPESAQAIEAMVEDVFATFPIAEYQCLAGGIGHGGLMAFQLEEQRHKNIAGIFAVNALYPEQNINIPTYLLCRSSSNARNRLVHNRGYLRDEYSINFYNPDEGEFDEGHVSFAILWLQGQILNSKGSKAAKNEYSTHLLAQIQSNLKSDPYLAFRQTKLLSTLKKMPNYKTAKNLLDDLEEEPDIAHYLKARKAMDRFIDDYLNVMPYEYENQYLNSDEPEKEAWELSKEFSETPFAELIYALGQKTPGQLNNK